MNYRDKRVLVTGGLGFIGSNLVLRLAQLGARVTVVDSCVLGCGANVRNLDPPPDNVEVLRADIAEPERFEEALRDRPIIFNLAGEVSHIHSMLFPERDLELNTLAQLHFLEACTRMCPGVRVVYAGTRQVYGAPKYLPVDEAHPVNPVDFNGVHKYAASMYHLMLSRSGELDCAVLRLTNVYGPRMALDVPCQGFLATYLRQTLTGQRLEVYGDGTQLRDPVFVDDVVDAFLRAGTAVALPSREYNVGGLAAHSLAEIAGMFSAAAGLEQPTFREFPPEKKQIDIGSYYTNSARIEGDFAWRATVGFEDGVRRTLDYYAGRLDQYMDPATPNPPCKLLHAGAPPKRRRIAGS